MITLTDATQAALDRIRRAPATSEQGRVQPRFLSTADGEIVIELGSMRGTVSSWHLVPGKLAQLRKALKTTITSTNHD